MRESAADEDRQGLRRRFHEQGYVVVRRALDPKAVLTVRADYFSRFPSSMFAEGTTPQEGVFSGVAPREYPEYGTQGHPAHDFVRAHLFDVFTHDARLRRIAETLLGGSAELARRRILRQFDRSSARASRAHIDYDYMDRGSDEVVTAWIPLGDCSFESGGLIYLENSHRAPLGEKDRLREHTDRPHDRRPISNDLALTARVLGGRWLWTDFRAGDVAFHSPHIVHASLDNRSDVIRLSADVRFRRTGLTHDERWDHDWSADDGN